MPSKYITELRKQETVACCLSSQPYMDKKALPISFALDNYEEFYEPEFLCCIIRCCFEGAGERLQRLVEMRAEAWPSLATIKASSPRGAGIAWLSDDQPRISGMWQRLGGGIWAKKGWVWAKTSGTSTL